VPERNNDTWSDGDDFLRELAPDLGPLRVVAEAAEFAEAIGRLGNGFGGRLATGDPLYPLVCVVARALVEAGFTLHQCAQHHPLYRLGGVCLLPVAPVHDPDGCGGVVVSWTTHDLLSKDWARWREYGEAHRVMNGALGGVLGGLGFQVRPFGTGGAWIVSGSRDVGVEAGL
jgi:hypothetical protein